MTTGSLLLKPKKRRCTTIVAKGLWRMAIMFSERSERLTAKAVKVTERGSCSNREPQMVSRRKGGAFCGFERVSLVPKSCRSVHGDESRARIVGEYGTPFRTGAGGHGGPGHSFALCRGQWGSTIKLRSAYPVRFGLLTGSCPEQPEPRGEKRRALLFFCVNYP